MKVEFTGSQPCDELLITAETEEEAINLSRWNNCVLSTKFDYLKGYPPKVSELLIVREI